MGLPPELRLMIYEQLLIVRLGNVAGPWLLHTPPILETCPVLQVLQARTMRGLDLMKT